MASSRTKSKSKSRVRPAAGASRESGDRKRAAQAGRPGRRAPLLLASLAVAALVVAAYSNSLSDGFVWDDHQQILNNPAVQAGAPLGKIFAADVRFDTHSQGLETSDYRPLQMLSYRLLMGSFGADATAFHACSVLLAVACALAAFVVFWQLSRQWPLAFASAAWFALYPIHTEAVDWIAALPELGFSLCLLLALACYLKSRNGSAQTSGTHSLATNRAFAVCSACLFAAALLWKETAIVFPLLIVASALADAGSAPFRERLRTALLASVSYWTLAVAYLALRWAVLGSVAKAPRNWDLTLPQLALNLLALMEEYWARLAWPFSLNAYYTFAPLRSFTTPRAILALLIAVIAVAGSAGLARLLSRYRAEHRTPNADAETRRFLPLCLFVVCWVFITLLPAMNLSALGRNPFTERYLFLPSAGFCLLITLLAGRLIRRFPQRARRYTGAGVLAVLCVVFFCTTVQRNAVWKDDITLFRTTLQRSPDAPFVHNMVATAESSDPAQADDAAGNYEESIDLALKQTPPDRVDAVVAYRGLAWIDAGRGQFGQALSSLDMANTIAPQDADTDGERGLILAQGGHGKEALPFLGRALAAEPNNENVLSAMGLIASEEQHDPQRAVAFFQRALTAHRAQDDFAASQDNNLATVYAQQGNYPAAAEQIRTAIRIVPGDPEFHANLANALAAQGQFAEARNEAQTALQLAPQVPAFQDLLKKIDQAASGR